MSQASDQIVCKLRTLGVNDLDGRSRGERPSGVARGLPFLTAIPPSPGAALLKV